MYAWGSTIHGELGLGGIEDEHILTPRVLDWNLANTVIDAALGDNHTLLLTREGKVYSCGSNDYGQLGHDQPRKRPQPVTGLDAHLITRVSCGSMHSMALNQWGHVFTWGSDYHGQLGQNIGENIQSIPKIIRALATYHIVQICCGQRHSIALANSGEILTWGANNFGQLGTGERSASEVLPKVINSLKGIPIAFIACGANHSFAISKSGAVYGWGKNTRGQLGLNDTDNKMYPTQLRTLRNIRVRSIACGEEFSTFLTLDGGVFTCGAGMFGQLGHEAGCTALVSADWGNWVSSKPTSAATPQVVMGPWVSPSGMSLVPTSTNVENLVVHRIFSGGDHCFVSVINQDSKVPPYDCREYEPQTQILTLSHDYVKNLLRIPNDGPVDQEVLSFLETVFKSLSCINGSFLLDDDKHYYCTSKHHGVDLEQAIATFSLIGKIENGSIKDLIWNCIVDDILLHLSPSPPDVETLRIYLTLPLYHEFHNPKQHLKLQKPFAKAVLNLKQPANKVLGSWWGMTNCDYFEKIVNVFKTVACYILRNQNIPEGKTAFYDPSLVAMLDLLTFLNKLNHNVDGLKVPYDTFHIVELSDFMDVRVDYVLWLSDPGTGKLFLCNYPFVFDAHAKLQLLETDQSIQMQNAMHNAAQQALLSMLLSPQGIHSINQFLVLNVTRDHIVDDALRELSQVNPSDLKKPLRVFIVKFCGEEAEDAGGVTKEFFLLLLREILDPKYGMFKEYEETRAIWFAENSFEDNDVYFLIDIQIAEEFNSFFIDSIEEITNGLNMNRNYEEILSNMEKQNCILGKFKLLELSLNDLKGLSPTMANSLQSLLDYQENDMQEVFSLTFDISRDIFGEAVAIPLKTNGSNIPVTQENKQEYVNLYINYIFNESVKQQYEAFHTGFMKVCGGRVLQLFHSHELMAVVVGNENYDWHALEEAAEYKNGYKSSDETIRWFWETLHEMTLVDKKKFLLFLTGSYRIPTQGMKAIKIVIQPTNDEKYLPVAHTCFNLLDLPRYKTKERLKYKLMQAIQQTEGFSLV
ncbi:hypothetical protein NQ314_011425 [Rhamnusium bicolor]|uniref:E3 ubiquitin-protein ligase HERC4 n=1 Tax=Rhamnusium bicolor TaxID=1586634 RepID=A0AAV8XIZ2_9CUCU|nr:hypothetical protein NQ314_011425 [Rhamnusium bicolor]